MKNNDLKEKIRKNVKEQIAISNIRKEFDMKTNRNKKIVYIVSSICAVFILGIGIFIGTNKLRADNIFKDNTLKIGKSEEQNENMEEDLKIELNINKLKDVSMARFDVDIKTIEIENLPEKFNFIKNIIIPNGFELDDSYNIYIRENKDTEEYNILHDYVFYYQKDSTNNIRIAFSEKEEPIRDYFINNEEENISKIGDVELIISNWKQMYLVNFKYENIYFDIETTGITEDELIVLLESLIDNVRNYNTNGNIILDEKDINQNEKLTEISTVNYPDYYGGKYIDDNGNNVILLCEDNTKNRKEICDILGISESKTIFKKAKYTYNYLEELQNKISKKMQDKELTFVTSSALMEDRNIVNVTVTSDNISDINKIKELDTLGGAINIQYQSNSIGTEDLLVNPE